MGPTPGYQDTSFADFVNPAKSEVPTATPPAGGSEFLPQQPSEQPAYQAAPVEPEMYPSEGFISIGDEKADLLFKLDRIRKKNITVRSFTMDSDVREMRADYMRVRNEIEFENNLRFSRKALMGVVSVLEWANKKWDPFDLMLDGFSESVCTGIDAYDPSLERIVAKWRNRVSCPPEVELILTLAGSALAFHMTNTLFAKASLPASGNPDLVKSMMGAFTGAATKPPQAPATAPAPPTAPGYQMRGPSIDLGPLMQTMGRPAPTFPAPPTTFMPPAQPSKAVAPSMPTPVNPTPVLPTATPHEDDVDRLSDVISEDLQSVRSECLSVESEYKTVQVEAATPRCRVSGRKRAANRQQAKLRCIDI